MLKFFLLKIMLTMLVFLGIQLFNLVVLLEIPLSFYKISLKEKPIKGYFLSNMASVIHETFGLYFFFLALLTITVTDMKEYRLKYKDGKKENKT